MLLSSANWLCLRRILRGRTTRLIMALVILVNFLDAVRIHQNIARNDRLGPRASGLSRPRERIYIASMHWNNGPILGDYWNDAVISLAETLGPENVFVSVYESGSWDNSKEMLRLLDTQLEKRRVARRIEVSDVTHRDEISRPQRREGWIDTARGKRELRRIPYLARLRNKTIRDLMDLAKEGITFDKVLFLNDVIFTADDVLTLMDTNGGEYAAACSLDYSKPPEYYDTFALRDDEGHAHLTQTWPYFRSRASRRAMVNHLDAVPVTSCWNGIVVMQAEPFTSASQLRFRGIPDSLAEHHLEGSECCLIHADNPLSKTMGVYVNPRVRVGYNPEAYEKTHPGTTTWVSTWDIFKGLWTNRLKRWAGTEVFERMVVRSRVRRWEEEEEGGLNHEPGEFCLINEMQVLVENGWAHV